LRVCKILGYLKMGYRLGFQPRRIGPEGKSIYNKNNHLPRKLTICGMLIDISGVNSVKSSCFHVVILLFVPLNMTALIFG